MPHYLNIKRTGRQVICASFIFVSVRSSVQSAQFQLTTPSTHMYTYMRACAASCMPAISHRKPACAAVYRDNKGAQGHEKRDTCMSILPPLRTKVVTENETHSACSSPASTSTFKIIRHKSCHVHTPKCEYSTTNNGFPPNIKQITKASS
jgi:hypothetical protein